MFPKLIKKASLEDVQKENPSLYEEMKTLLSAEIGDSISATLQVTHKELFDAEIAKNISLSAEIDTLKSKYNILSAGVEAKQSELASKLIAEGKSEVEALAEIAKAKTSLESFTASAPEAAGSGSASDAQVIDNQAKAVDAIMKVNPTVTHATAIRMARREYPHLFVSPSLTNHSEKRQ